MDPSVLQQLLTNRALSGQQGQMPGLSNSQAPQDIQQLLSGAQGGGQQAYGMAAMPTPNDMGSYGTSPDQSSTSQGAGSYQPMSPLPPNYSGQQAGIGAIGQMLGGQGGGQLPGMGGGPIGTGGQPSAPQRLGPQQPQLGASYQPQDSANDRNYI